MDIPRTTWWESIVSAMPNWLWQDNLTCLSATVAFYLLLAMSRCAGYFGQSSPLSTCSINHFNYNGTSNHILKKKNAAQTQQPSFLTDFPLNRNNSLGNPAGVHMLLITLGYLVPQDDMLLNGLLMVIGSFLSLPGLMSFTSLLLMPCRYLERGQMRCYNLLLSKPLQYECSASDGKICCQSYYYAGVNN